jgi:hypothetical protein
MSLFCTWRAPHTHSECTTWCVWYVASIRINEEIVHGHPLCSAATVAKSRDTAGTTSPSARPRIADKRLWMRLSGKRLPPPLSREVHSHPRYRSLTVARLRRGRRASFHSRAGHTRGHWTPCKPQQPSTSGSRQGRMLGPSLMTDGQGRPDARWGARALARSTCSSVSRRRHLSAAATAA